ncbi:MAG: hypothetical protein HZB16_06110 [Armatimonadetes bacterium]|nr:hypothetical protein [Armatimonadota bacterium]
MSAPIELSEPSVLLGRLDAVTAGLPFPADKPELLAALADDTALAWLVAAMPGRLFAFRSDVQTTAALSLELGIERPWPEHSRRAQWLSDGTLARSVEHRLALCRGTNAWLIRVGARAGLVTLDGRCADVAGGVMAARVALGIVPEGRLLNRLAVQW